MSDNKASVRTGNTIVKALALALCLSFLAGLTGCNFLKSYVPTVSEVRSLVSDKYDKSFMLDSNSIADDRSEAEWVFTSRDGELRVTVNWSADTGEFSFKDERISSGEPVTTTEPNNATDPVPEETEPAESASGTTNAPDALIKVGIISVYPNDPLESSYRKAVDEDLKRVFCRDNGYDAGFFYGNKTDDQIDSARKFIKDEYDYLLICAAGSDGWDEVLTEAKNAGVKVIIFDRSIDAGSDLYDAIVRSDLTKQGEMAVNWLASQSLGEYKVLHLQGLKGSPAQAGRTAPLEAKASADSNWTLVDQLVAEWNEDTAKKAVKSAISSGKSFNVIYAESDEMAKGAAAALKEAGISYGVGGDVTIVSFGYYKWALNEVLAGKWNYEVYSNPFQASFIDDVIKNGVRQKKVDVEDKGFDAKSITNTDVEKFGL